MNNTSLPAVSASVGILANKEIFGVRLVDASTRFLVGRFKVSNLLEVKFEEQINKFYSLWKRYGEIQSNLK